MSKTLTKLKELIGLKLSKNKLAVNTPEFETIQNRPTISYMKILFTQEDELTMIVHLDKKNKQQLVGEICRSKEKNWRFSECNSGVPIFQNTDLHELKEMIEKYIRSLKYNDL